MADDCPHRGAMHRAAVALARAAAEIVERSDFDGEVTLVLASNVCDCVATITPDDSAEKRALQILRGSVEVLSRAERKSAAN